MSTLGLERLSNPDDRWTRRRFLGTAAGTVGGALLPATAQAKSRRRPRRRQSVLVLGGGVAGLTAAHELVDRGFAVTVCERRALGGKARSMNVPHSATGGRRPLPGEHGMRTFPGFYQNLPDTLRRIPFGSNANGVFENLVACSQLDFSRNGGREDLILPLTLSSSWTVDQFRRTMVAFFEAGMGIPPQESSYFVDRLLVFFSSCEARRYHEWERTSWAAFTNSGRYSADYRRLLTGWINRQLLSARSSEASALTVGILWEAGIYNLMGRTGNGPFDRVLDRPTNEAWIDPWVAHLRHRGVRFEFAEVERLAFDRQQGVSHAVVRHQDGRRERRAADWFVLAVPVERAVPLLEGEAMRVDASLARTASLRTALQAGIQFYVRRRVPIVNGHVLYVDSPWAVSSISQAQFWPSRQFSRVYGNGSALDCVSVDIADWDTPGIVYGKPAGHCTPAEIAHETWAQLKASLNDTGGQVLRDRDLVSWFLDPGVKLHRGRLTSEDPLMISTPGSWPRRPEAATRIPNLVLAADYVRTQINTACMEGANEAARRAVNALLSAAGSHATPVRVYPLFRPPEFEALKKLDAQRYAHGQPNVFDGPAPPPGPSPALNA